MDILDIIEALLDLIDLAEERLSETEWEWLRDKLDLLICKLDSHGP